MNKLVKGAAIIAALFALSGCGNYKFWDTTYTFNKAICEFPGGKIREFDISTWTDYGDGEQIQITDKDGNTYLVSANYCVLSTGGK